MKAENIVLTEPATLDGASEWARGWRPLSAAFIGMGTGWTFANMSAGLFLKPMQADFGWSRTELSYGPAAGFIVAVLLPFTAMLIDRFGARQIAIAGLLAICGAFLLFASIPADRTYFVAAVIFLGMAGAACNSVVLAAGVAPWFDRNLGTAFGLMMTGASLSAAIVIPLLSLVIASYGWRGGFVALAMMTLCIGVPVALLWFREPADQQPSSHGAAKAGHEPWSALVVNRAFWQLGLACAFASLPIGGFLAHLVPLLTDGGLTPARAAGFAAVFAVGVALGRISNGILVDRFNPPLVTAATLALAGVGAGIFYVSDIGGLPGVALAATIVLIGLAQGAEGDYSKFFSMRLFGRANFARVVAVMSMVISCGMATGGIIFARAFDLSGTYDPALAGGIVFYLFSGLMFLTIRLRPTDRRGPGSARGRSGPLVES